MKRTGYIYDRICDADNIKYAIRMAARRKTNQRSVARILENIDEYSENLSQILREKAYIPSPYKIKVIKDKTAGKSRVISCPKFWPDQVIHWAVMTPLRHVLSRGVYEHSAGGMPGKGAHSAYKTCRKWIVRDPRNTKYVLKMDVRHFYQSVDNNVLKVALRKIIKDRDALWLLDTIIDSAAGLPIGNYTSVWLSDIYLRGLDRLIKQDLKAVYYLRYVDDMVVFGRNKKDLHKTRKAISEYLKNELRLEMKGNWQVFPLRHRDLDFLGYRINRTRTILRKKTSLRIRRRVKKIASKGTVSYRDAAAMVSYFGLMDACNSYNFKVKHVWPNFSKLEMRKVISKWKKQNRILHH